MLQDNEAAVGEIMESRLAYTNVTCWWGNGDRSVLIYIVPENAFKAAEVARLNLKYPNDVFIMTSGKNHNHFADGENNIEMFEKGPLACQSVRRVDSMLPPQDS